MAATAWVDCGVVFGAASRQCGGRSLGFLRSGHCDRVERCVDRACRRCGRRYRAGYRDFGHCLGDLADVTERLFGVELYILIGHSCSSLLTCSVA